MRTAAAATQAATAKQDVTAAATQAATAKQDVTAAATQAATATIAQCANDSSNRTARQ
ncbi:MAG: hypothetical protein GX562_06880 [Coriobacteriaceae bacterium]|nr:hypothetical protein [Coriobacteriaceae bacterium]